MDDCLNSGSFEDGRFEELDNLVYQPKGRPEGQGPSELWQLARQIATLRLRAREVYLLGDREGALDLQMQSHPLEREFKTAVDDLNLFGDVIPSGITVGDVHLTLQIYTGPSDGNLGKWFVTDAYLAPVLDIHGRPVAVVNEALP